jgi:2'-hydroxyisoflavone reductase
LGGTIFLGRALVEAALAREHKVTLFNRGQANPELFPHIEKLRGDRDGNLEALRGKNWDAVIDTCGYLPRLVRLSADFLTGAVDHYTFISTISIYTNPDPAGFDESAPIGTLEDRTVEEITDETYGPLKAMCERAVEEAMPSRALILRPGLIVGPHDPTDRFTYWPWRVAKGGEVLAPDPPERRVQIIDVRDLAEWTIGMIEAGRTGVFNTTGPADQLALVEVLDGCKLVSTSDCSFTWVTEDFLVQRDVALWAEIPLCLPAEYAGTMAADCSKAIAAGLSFRPLKNTIQDTLTWIQERDPESPLRAGLTLEREVELLEAWHNL